ncbi:MAG: energy-coupling factor ABC transporter ATP-binding protein [Thermoplasmata archaeon]
MAPAIEVRGFRFRYRGSATPALRDVNFEARDGDVVLVTGPTGSGKSTLLRALNGLIPDFYEGEVHGDVRVAGRDVLSLRPNQAATFVGSVFQSPQDQIIARTVHRDVAFGLENLGWEKETIIRRVDQSLETVGLSQFRDQPTSSLSGGQMQRLALAGVVAMRPQVLLLDEPASELDPAGRRAILDTLRSLARTRRRAILITDHRLNDLVGFVDRVVVLHQGQVALDGPPRAVMASPELEAWGVEVPPAIRVWRRLQERGVDLRCPLTSEELVNELVPQGRTLSDALEAAA